jgi:hypothetical protein
MELIKFIPINTGEKFIDNTINVTITKNNKQQITHTAIIITTPSINLVFFFQ